MIDDKEIDIAARVQVLSKHVNETAYFQLRSIEDFKDGAKWAINEFLKDLWHPASEEPKRHSYIMFKTANNNGFGTEYIDCSWKTLARCLQITQWLYAEDLLPKEGGEQ
jgi:hypothetical protein